jgi:hypothetical protein
MAENTNQKNDHGAGIGDTPTLATYQISCSSVTPTLRECRGRWGRPVLDRDEGMEMLRAAQVALGLDENPDHDIEEFASLMLTAADEGHTGWCQYGIEWVSVVRVPCHPPAERVGPAWGNDDDLIGAPG